MLTLQLNSDADAATVMAALPPVGREIEGAIGLDATLRLCASLGGIRFRVPLKASTGGQLLDALGLDDAVRLVDAMGGSVLEVPRLCAAPVCRARCSAKRGTTR